jgi:indole-3-glycerol phosphate synthase
MKRLDPNTQLYKIIEAKKASLAEKKREKPYEQLKSELEAVVVLKVPSLFNAVKSPQAGPKLIAEVKKASPSRGVIRESFSLSEINDAYQSSAHVVAISVLTETDYFQGSEEILAYFAANNTHNKPLLRKDFIFDPYQVLESTLLGAHAYLLIASLFDDTKELEELINLGYEIGIEPLVEVHNREELEFARSTRAKIIGINCRDLNTFKLDIQVHELLKELDDSYARIAESGIDNQEYLQYVSAFCDAALVGSHFMAQADIAEAIEGMVTP